MIRIILSTGNHKLLFIAFLFNYHSSSSYTHHKFTPFTSYSISRRCCLHWLIATSLIDSIPTQKPTPTRPELDQSTDESHHLTEINWTLCGRPEFACGGTPPLSLCRMPDARQPISISPRQPKRNLHVACEANERTSITASSAPVLRVSLRFDTDANDNKQPKWWEEEDEELRVRTRGHTT